MHFHRKLRRGGNLGTANALEERLRALVNEKRAVAELLAFLDRVARDERCAIRAVVMKGPLHIVTYSAVSLARRRRMELRMTSTIAAIAVASMATGTIMLKGERVNDVLSAIATRDEAFASATTAATTR